MLFLYLCNHQSAPSQSAAGPEVLLIHAQSTTSLSSQRTAFYCTQKQQITVLNKLGETTTGVKLYSKIGTQAAEKVKPSKHHRRNKASLLWILFVGTHKWIRLFGGGGGGNDAALFQTDMFPDK